VISSANNVIAGEKLWDPGLTGGPEGDLLSTDHQPIEPASRRGHFLQEAGNTMV
jgi:hypothetical protein